ncbi:MAG: sterol desaturase family protein [Nevskia sp.]|nr:sterol desaturase family protein [Nevskia sp.]
MSSTLDNLILYFIPVFILSIGAELLYARRRQQELYETRDSFACLAMGIGNLAVAIPMKLFWIWLYTLVYRYRIFEMPMSAWWSWLLLFFGDEFCYYWFHRAHHRVRLLWCTHVNHHSSQRFNFAVALRQPWTESFSAYWFWLPLPLLGFHPLAVIAMQSISLIYQFFVHTEAVRSLGPLEYLINTPAHHRVHHGSNPRYIDKNFGGMLIIWDRLFGSFEPEIERVHYGLVHNIATFNPVRIAFHEFAAMTRDVRQAKSWSELWVAVAREPGASGAR